MKSSIHRTNTENIMAEEKKNPAQEQKTNRQLMGERFRMRNPEFNIDDDEAMYGEALAELGKADEAEAARKRLNEAIAGSDVAPELINGILSGKNADGSDFDLEDYITEQHIDYFLDYLENKETARQKRDARKLARKQEAEFKAKANELIKAEDAELDAAAAEMGYKPEQIRDLIEWLYGKEKEQDKSFIARAARYELKKDDFLKLFKIKDYDLKISEAEDKGYKRGKNEKIDMFKRDQKRRKDMPADAGSGGGTPTSGGDTKDPYLARLEHMKDL